MKKIFLFLGIFLSVFHAGCSADIPREPEKIENVKTQTVSPDLPKVAMVADFEAEDPKILNNLGGETGDWNLNPADANNSYTDLKIVKMPGKDGNASSVLRLTYSVDSDVPAQNGFWTKLKDLDGSQYDHLEFEIKGDPEEGFTEKFRLELKKCLDAPQCLETIQGSAVVPVTGEWSTVSIPLNKMTGLIDFANPECWKNPLRSYDSLDELIIIFNDKFVTQKTGRIYLDNIRFVKTGAPGPSAVDQPHRSGEKTSLHFESPEYQKFLAARLRGFPSVVTVKKESPAEERAFLTEIARDTWKYFDLMIDAENHLPLDNVQLGEEEPLGKGAWIGDYTNVTNIGIYFMSVVSAYDLGFITREDAVSRIKATLEV
ncbi:MAG TPA: carbohydrate binding domain-containing protein, partial [Candidatus Omnitrophota bacterium]|nr:carbohydrate binding domain-containing protein [Candidatus Omnitrophota bacterium]